MISRNSALEIASGIPCSDAVKNIIHQETGSGNEISAFSNVSGHPSETYLILQFNDAPKHQYPGIQLVKEKTLIIKSLYLQTIKVLSKSVLCCPYCKDTNSRVRTCQQELSACRKHL